MSPYLAFGLWFAGFGLLWLGAIQAAMQQVEGSVVKMMSWNFVRIETLLMGVLSWAFLNQPSDSIVLFALLISIPLWFSYLVRIATVLAWPAGRWLLPIAHVDVDCQTLTRDGLLNLGVGLVAPWRVVKWRRVKWGTLEWSWYCSSKARKSRFHCHSFCPSQWSHHGPIRPKSRRK